jgi:hypothetical protein
MWTKPESRAFFQDFAARRRVSSRVNPSRILRPYSVPSTNFNTSKGCVDSSMKNMGVNDFEPVLDFFFGWSVGKFMIYVFLF